MVGGLVIGLVYNSSVRASVRGAYQMIDDAYFVNPAPVPKPLMILGFGGIFFPIIAVSLAKHYLGDHPNAFLVFALAALISCIVYYGVEWLLRRNAKRYRSEIKITLNDGSITFGDKSVPKKNITRLVMRNHVLEIQPADEQAFVISRGNTYEDTMTSAGLAVSSSARSFINNWRNLAGQSSFRIDLESGGKAFVVAGGLDEVTAYGLMSDLARELNL